MATVNANPNHSLNNNLVSSSKMPMMRRRRFALFRSIRSRMTTVFIALATLPLVLVGIILGWQGYEQQQEQAFVSQNQLAERAGTDVSNFIANLEGELHLVLEVHRLVTHSTDEQQHILQDLIAYEGSFDQLMLVDSQGKEQARVSRFTANGTSVLLDYSAKSEFAVPKVTHESYYSPVSFNDITGEPRMTIAVPVLDDSSGDTKWVLIADARVKKIWDLIQGMKLDAHDNLYIVDSQQRIIAHRDPAVVLSKTLFTVPSSDGFQTGLDGNTVFLVRHNLQFGNQTFTIIAEKPVSDALALATNTLLIIIIVTAVALITASLIGFLAVRGIVHPIQTLAKATHRISQGDLTQTVEVNSEDEIGDLAHSFDSMRVQLHETLEGLEQRVSDRTRDLQIAAHVAQQITTVLDINQLLEKVVTLVAKSFDLYAVVVFLMDQDGQRLVNAASSSEKDAVTPQSMQSILIEARPSIIALAARTRQVVIIDDVAKSQDFMPIPALPNTRSEVAIPMMIGERVLGVFDLQSEVVGRFAKEDFSVLTALAEQIAIAVRNAQLFTEAQAARQEAERSNKVKSQFLASMSHELRTPLNAILNFTQFVATGVMGPVNDEQVETLNSVVTSGKHLLNLINDVLDISKIESGALKLYVQRNVFPSEIMKWIGRMAEPLLEGKPIKLVIDAEPELPTMVGDDRRIRQILLNLVSNACKFTDNGTVTITAHRQSDSILFSVQDTGPGIAPEDRDAIFEIFRQTEIGLRHGGGTGLGLPISRRLAEAHGGQLWLESVSGQGATFYVLLPIDSPQLVPVEQTVGIKVKEKENDGQ